MGKRKKKKWVCNPSYTGKPVVFELPKESMNPLKRGGVLIVEGIPGDLLLGSLETNVPIHIGFKTAFHFLLDLEKSNWMDRNIFEMPPYIHDYVFNGYRLGLDPWSLRHDEIEEDKKYRLVISGSDREVFIYNFEEEGE